MAEKATIYGANEDPDTEKEIWKLVHSKKKYVFSRTQNEIDNQAIFINDNILEEVNKLKKKPGKDIWLYGGASLITTFINLGLVDEFRLSIHPVVLGEGKPLFIDVKQRINFVFPLLEKPPIRYNILHLS